MRRCYLMAGIAMTIMCAKTTSALARARGIVADNCQSCHGGAELKPPELSLTPDTAPFKAGDLVNFTLKVTASTIKVGGASISTGGVGALRALVGEGLQVNGQGLTHSAPKPAVDGSVTFRFAWQAPNKPGGVDIRVAALVGNNDNAPTGDSPGDDDFQWTFGCPPRTFYSDFDRDGYGAKSAGAILGCDNEPPPLGYAATDGDCDDNDEIVHPGSNEVCNRKDDDCNGQIDEGLSPVTMWPDADGDGYYRSQTGGSRLGCGDIIGYAATAGDCNDSDPAIHPGATELCNLQDDDCDGDVDERVRPRCGVGWCARESLSCSLAECHPGAPMAEICNSVDDDCDGEVDNGACAIGPACGDGSCSPTAGRGGTFGLAGTSDGGQADVAEPPSGGDADMAGGSRILSANDGCALALGRPLPLRSPAPWWGGWLAVGACAVALRVRRRVQSRASSGPTCSVSRRRTSRRSKLTSAL